MEVSETPGVEEAGAEPNGSEVELEAALERVRRLIEASDVEGARALARDLDQRWPDDTRVRYWARVLAPPEVRAVKGERARPLDREMAWLREHAREYPGCWLAVFGDQLVTAHRELREVLRTVRETPGVQASLLHFEPPAEP
jgi:hypothetical protein